MSEHITRDELDRRFDDLKEWMGEKFDGVYARQDKTNGRVDKVEEKVGSHDKDITRVKTLWGGAVVVATFYHQIVDGVKKWLTS